MPSNEPAPPATPAAVIDTEETMELSARSNKPSLVAAAVLGLLALGASAQARAQDGVPDGTLAYTLVVTGHADTTADDGSSIDSRIHWQVEGRFHLKGYAIASQAGLDARNDSAVLSAASGLEQAVSACGDDQACMASAAMHYAQTHQSAAAAVRNAGARHHVLGRNPAWQFLGGECDATGVVDDSETDTGTDVGEGYSKSESDHGTRVGKHSLECGSVGSRLKMTGDSSSRTYALAIPWLDIPVTVSGDGIGSSPGTVHGQDLKLIGLRLRPLHDVQHGSKVVRRTMTASPVYGIPTHIPIRETLTWTFTPAKR
jgi:hypothetical protein